MYKRVLLKLSGEALGEKDSTSIIDVSSLESICEKIKILHDGGMEIAIVIGAGNIWRGKIAEKIGIERVSADFMGMLGTVINAVAMSSFLKKIGVDSVVYSAIPEIKDVKLVLLSFANDFTHHSTSTEEMEEVIKNEWKIVTGSENFPTEVKHIVVDVKDIKIS